MKYYSVTTLSELILAKQVHVRAVHQRRPPPSLPPRPLPGVLLLGHHGQLCLGMEDTHARAAKNGQDRMAGRIGAEGQADRAELGRGVLVTRGVNWRSPGHLPVER